MVPWVGLQGVIVYFLIMLTNFLITVATNPILNGLVTYLFLSILLPTWKSDIHRDTVIFNDPLESFQYYNSNMYDVCLF